jgi:hypothetical protein
MAENIVRPPLSGVGSGRVAWSKYAEHLGLEVDEAARLTDIIQACTEAEADMRAEAAADPAVFDEADPYAFIQHRLGAEFVSIDGREYRVNPVTGYAVERIS